jgi:L-cysteine S-thiosulfotransferase
MKAPALLWTAALAAPLLAGMLAAAAPDAGTSTIVGDAIPQSLTGTSGDPVRGRAIVASRQTGLCLLCHAAPIAEVKLQGNIGPDLKGVGARLSEGQLRLRVVDSRKVDPDSIMPSYYRFGDLTRVATSFRDKPVLTPEQIEDVVAYLVTLRD